MDFVQPPVNFEQEGRTPSDDETSINLRAYFDRMPSERLLSYSPSLNDEDLVVWDGNFKDDGTLFLPCSERDVDAAEYRRVLEAAIEHRRKHQ